MEPGPLLPLTLKLTSLLSKVPQRDPPVTAMLPFSGEALQSRLFLFADPRKVL